MEKGDEVFLEFDSPETAGKFYDYGIEYGDRGVITRIREIEDEYDYFVKFESYSTELLVSKDEISKFKCRHDISVYSSERESWVCPFCEDD